MLAIKLALPDAGRLLTSFLPIFGVVFLNFEVLKRFMLPSQNSLSCLPGVSVELVGTRQRAPATADRSGWPRGEGVRSVCFTAKSSRAEFPFYI